MTKEKIVEAVRRIHERVNGKTKLDTFAVLERIDHISMKVLMGNGKRRDAKASRNQTGANR